MKAEYSKNYDRYIDIQNKVILLQRLGVYESQTIEDFNKIEKDHQKYLQMFEQLRKELLKHTLGLFYVREEALNTIGLLDKIRGG